ncbi:protein artichoke [Toxorhynchites rutilus septentrionalis]|uniref:protein artichoke n=1 Tax=Toxorhynchites rutilus septentrionalis TaxID=329112 RepID=UPI0024783629|nr:protein artichoke [Toxorhynchites rutilus septentrionalis]XP_055629541.1 protein artichoke [Toxorhynchites rutilus septentrionalis]XP_055629542.1 protein artichoke [Toxorhynchites rutilus septentrionalis]XP_055629543.1 protein artichoke [Toxorhynchites rutilus septentrionalis]
MKQFDKHLLRRLNVESMKILLLVILIATSGPHRTRAQRDTICPPQDIILPCRCSQRGSEIQIWCSHSDLPRVLTGLKAVAKSINRPIDELILENNFLPSLPGRTFAPLNILRLMLRHNGLERVSNGWLNDLDSNLVEVFIVERNLRSLPVDSLAGLRKLEAVTIQSDSLKRLPDFSGLPRLRYISVQSSSLIGIAPQSFRDLKNLETIHITGSRTLARLEGGLFNDLPKLNLINLSENGIDWVHLRAFVGLPSLKSLQLSGNRIADAGMIGRAVKDIPNLAVLKLDRNTISKLNEGSFVDLPSLKELYLNDNTITEMYHGAFHRTPSLKLVHLENNYLRRVHPESFLQASGSGVEIIHLQHNEIGRIEELRSLLDALPMLRFLDMSHNQLDSIPFGALRGHGTLEQLYLNNNRIRMIERDAFMAMPGLRELRLRNNSLSDLLPMPFWNLPGLKGVDISYNNFRRVEPSLLIGIPSLRRLDLSGNTLSVLDPAAFVHTPLLETVNISFNELNLIHPSTFRDLNRMFEIDAGNNKLQEFIPGLPLAVERINLRDNQIVNLPQPSSNLLDLPALRMLDISGNHMTRVAKNTFQTTAQLRYISLARNQLQSIDEGSLAGLNRLEVLNLQDNRLLALHERSLSTLENLRELNLQGNRIEVLVDHLLDNNGNLEQFDASRNSIVEISPKAFRNSRSLQTLDLSSNKLRELPESLSGLSELREIDVSFNQISELTPSVLGSWRNLEELKVSNNKVNQLHQGSLRNLPLLQYMDLSSNELTTLEHGSLRNLPELQELVLADNKLAELKERVFEDLPNLQAVHLQQNNLQYISPYSFYRSPSIVYLNLSTNQFRNLDSVGLHSVRNLEVLDLTGNSIRKITPNPLRGLDWLVELKLDDNQICGIQGEPFATMPRLRVLSMRNNRMSRVPEQIFRNLRTNIAILDVDGNPLDCNCDMLWYLAWLQETRNLYPGPRCRDGKMLLETRLSRNECHSDARIGVGHDDRAPVLTNEHGDVFLRTLDFDDCENENYEALPPGPGSGVSQANDAVFPPSPVESEYFSGQYIDYPNALNDSHITGRSNASTFSKDPPGRHNYSQNFVDFNNNKFNHLYNQPVQNGSPFTFFGVPIPSLNIGKMFGGPARASSNRAAIGTRGKGRVQIYRPDDPAIVSIYKNGDRADSSTVVKVSDDNQEKNPGASNDNNLFYRPYFQTPFQKPNVQKGGFTPVIPGSEGGFTPIGDPNIKIIKQNISGPGRWPEEFTDQVPLVTEATRFTHKKQFEATIKPSHHAPYFVDGISQGDLIPTPAPPKGTENAKESTNRSYVTEKPNVPTIDSDSEHSEHDEDDDNDDVDQSTDRQTVHQPKPPSFGNPKHAENDLTTRLTIELGTATTFNPLEYNKPYTLHKNEQTTTRELTRAPTSEFYDGVNHSPSSLSALVSGGAPQQNMATGSSSTMPKRPVGKSTIEKVPAPQSSTVTPFVGSSPRGNEYNPGTFRTVPKYDNALDFATQNIIDLAQQHDPIGGNEIRKREDMDWYYATYNRTPIYEYDFEELGLNRYKSATGRALVSGWAIVIAVAAMLKTVF